MGKPSGVALGMTEQGPRLYVSTITHAEDAVWEAVQEAINEGWSPRRFKREAAQAWREVLERDTKTVMMDWRER